ncbi:hypothetical protein EVJ58_g6479 [Rhodofomes roseus]|uniref:Ubiquitin-like protease family profile domain-containing protein n=1 Tax=Rhodofomes roseus TaxID=34475 RepID=A0A4Y9YBU2_9APHY|nr:hypothetical protein EVJ58_g6479 [Rhodofomes roseus]
MSGPARAANPFAGRMGDTLHSSTRGGPSGNRTAQATVLPTRKTTVGPAAKRPRLSGAFNHPGAGKPGGDMLGLAPSKYFPPKSYKGKEVDGRGSRRDLELWNNSPAEVIDITDEDDAYKAPHIENLMQTPKTRRDASDGSPDPLDCIGEDSFDLHEARTISNGSQQSSSRRQSAPDGAATLRIREKVAAAERDKKGEHPGGGDDSDGIEEIESFSDEPTQSRIPGPQPPQGIVRRNRLLFREEPDFRPNERPKEEPGLSLVPSSRPKKAHDPPPEREVRTIDLVAAHSKLSRKDAMKPRSTQGAQPRTSFGSSNDPLAGSSGFGKSSIAKSTRAPTPGPSTRARKKIQGVPPKDLLLPLEGFSWGCTFCEDEDDDLLYWLTWERGSDCMHVRKPIGEQSPFEAEVLHELHLQFNSWMYTQTPFNEELPLVVSIKPTPSRVNKQDDSLLYKPGSKGNLGMVTLSFKAKYLGIRESYGMLTTSLETLLSKVAVNYLDGNGAKARWEQVKSAAALAWQEPASSIAPSARPKRQNASKQQGDISTLLSNQGTKTRTTFRPHFPGAPSETDSEATATRRSARLNTDPSPSPGPDELILVYPPSGAGAININKSDLRRLDDGCYLNDTLIEFGLKLWLADLKEKDPSFAEQVHVFSSFFYKKLNVKDKDEGYQSVRKWTSKVDLFQKKYIVVPINEHFHWYLAIICNPEYVLLPPLPSTEQPKPMTRKRKRDSGAVDEQEAAPQVDTVAQPSNNASGIDVVPGSCPPSPTSGGEDEVEGMIGGQAPPADADESRPPSAMGGDYHANALEELANMHLDYPNSSSPLAMTVDLPPAVPVQPIDVVDADQDVEMSVDPSSFYGSTSPTHMENTAVLRIEEDDHNRINSSNPESEKCARVFIFDSLGSKHPQAQTTLERYLQLEAKDKKGVEQSRNSIRKLAYVPSQPNYCDCGVYVLHFMRVFMENPDWYTQLILSQKGKGYGPEQRKTDWKGDEVRKLRGELRARILSLSETWKAERQAKEEARKKDASNASDTPSGGPDPTVIDDSDDEVIIEDTTTISKPRGRAQR